MLAEPRRDVFLLISGARDGENHSTIAAVFNNAMKLLWHEEVRRKNVHLFLIDSAARVVKAPTCLRILTCLAHALHTVD